MPASARCAWCRGPLDPSRRAKVCGPRCNQAHWRFSRLLRRDLEAAMNFYWHQWLREWRSQRARLPETPRVFVSVAACWRVHRGEVTPTVALQTFAMYSGVNGTVTFDYDDVSLIIQTVHVRPTPGFTINVQITNTGTGKTFTRAFTSNQDFNVAAFGVVFDKFQPNPTYTAQVW